MMRGEQLAYLVASRKRSTRNTLSVIKVMRGELGWGDK